MKPLLWVDENGSTPRSMEELPSELGNKAAGLLAIPSDWTPPFVVVSPMLFSDFATASPSERSAVVAPWCGRIAAALRERGVGPEESVIVRSNAVAEGLQDRGSYSSRESNLDDLAANLRILLSELLAVARNTPVGLIVQRYVEPMMTGHLSNERRVAKDFRDAEILATSVETGEMTEHKIVHRNWRRSDELHEGPLWWCYSR